MALAGLACVVATSALASAIAATGTADLGVDQTDSADPIGVGDPLVYTATVANRGPDPATGVRVVDKLPARLDFVGASSSEGTCTHSGRRVVCEIDQLAVDATARVAVRVRPTVEGVLTNTIVVGSRETDPRAADDSDSERTLVDNPEPTICAGREANVIGTEGDDDLVGSDGNDVIAGLGGNDAINGGGGIDVICGSGGEDAIKGKRGDDFLRGGGGNDAIKGGDGADTVQGKGGNDALRGGRGQDLLKGGGGDDSCDGGSGRDEEKSC